MAATGFSGLAAGGSAGLGLSGFGVLKGLVRSGAGTFAATVIAGFGIGFFGSAGDSGSVSSFGVTADVPDSAFAASAGFGELVFSAT